MNKQADNISSDSSAIAHDKPDVQAKEKRNKVLQLLREAHPMVSSSQTPPIIEKTAMTAFEQKEQDNKVKLPKTKAILSNEPAVPVAGDKIPRNKNNNLELHSEYANTPGITKIAKQESRMNINEIRQAASAALMLNKLASEQYEHPGQLNTEYISEKGSKVDKLRELKKVKEGAKKTADQVQPEAKAPAVPPGQIDNNEKRDMVQKKAALRDEAFNWLMTKQAGGYYSAKPGTQFDYAETPGGTVKTDKVTGATNSAAPSSEERKKFAAEQAAAKAAKAAATPPAKTTAPAPAIKKAAQSCADAFIALMKKNAGEAPGTQAGAAETYGQEAPAAAGVVPGGDFISGLLDKVKSVGNTGTSPAPSQSRLPNQLITPTSK